MEKDTLQGKRFIDLSKQADRKNIVTFSDFLNLNEQNIFYQNKNLFETSTILSGGYEYAERQIAAFLPDALSYDWVFPITCLKIIPSYPKFSDKLTHRDILGSIMNLGIERSKIGDILLQQNDYYLFCCESISHYIIENLEKIKHTIVTVTIVDGKNLNIVPEFEELSGVISSNRLDAIIACICHISRSQSSDFIIGGKAFINGKEILHNTYICKEGDIISIRSIGKFVFKNISGETKKGHLKLQYLKYV